VVITTFFRRLWYFVQQRRADAEVQAELDFHRELKARQLEANGLSPVAASMAAQRALGNTLLALEDARAVWVWPWLESVWQDGAYAARVMRRQVGSSLLAVAILAVTIGLNTTLATVLNGLLLKPWPGVGHGRNVVALYLNESRSDLSDRLLGLYGIVATSIGDRVRDLGLRIALGSSPPRTFIAAAWPGLVVSVAGIGVGIALARASAVLVRSLIWGVQPADPVTFAGAAFVGLAVAVLAVVIPTMRPVPESG
jgi:hypothetical protein